MDGEGGMVGAAPGFFRGKGWWLLPPRRWGRDRPPIAPPTTHTPTPGRAGGRFFAQPRTVSQYRDSGLVWQRTNQTHTPPAGCRRGSVDRLEPTTSTVRRATGGRESPTTIITQFGSQPPKQTVRTCNTEGGCTLKIKHDRPATKNTPKYTPLRLQKAPKPKFCKQDPGNPTTPQMCKKIWVIFFY